MKHNYASTGRSSRGISERELARLAALSHATVNHLVTGRRQSCSVATARAVASVLGVDVTRLFVT